MTAVQQSQSNRAVASKFLVSTFMFRFFQWGAVLFYYDSISNLSKSKQGNFCFFPSGRLFCVVSGSRRHYQQKSKCQPKKKTSYRFTSEIRNGISSHELHLVSVCWTPPTGCGTLLILFPPSMLRRLEIFMSIHRLVLVELHLVYLSIYWLVFIRLHSYQNWPSILRHNSSSCGNMTCHWFESPENLLCIL